MPKLDVKNIAGETVGSVELSDEVFGAEVNEHLLWEVVRAQRAGWRSGTAKTKGRTEVRGGGRKPYRQKGTGRARQGSSRAPNHVGGGTVFGPLPRSYRMRVPKKVRQGALRSAVSLRVSEEHLIVLDRIELPEIKTRGLLDVLGKLSAPRSLIVEERDNRKLALSARNLPNCKVLPVEGLNVYDVLKHETLVLTTETARALDERLSPSGDAPAGA
jgi:large subunit ribosomal protein L4